MVIRIWLNVREDARETGYRPGDQAASVTDFTWGFIGGDRHDSRELRYILPGPASIPLDDPDLPTMIAGPVWASLRGFPVYSWQRDWIREVRLARRPGKGDLIRLEVPGPFEYWGPVWLASTGLGWKRVEEPA